MEIASDSITHNKNIGNRVARYKMWKQGLHKWDEFVHNRHKVHKQIDPWSQQCMDQAQGKTAVYNSGGMFFYDIQKDIVAIEHSACPIEVPGMIYIDNNFNQFDGSFNTLIMINPIALKYHSSIWDFLARPGQSRAGYKGNILRWLTGRATVFLSFSDWHMYYDRLRYKPKDFINLQLKILEQQGISCTHCEVLPSGNDIVNGNVKLVLKLPHIESHKI